MNQAQSAAFLAVLEQFVLDEAEEERVYDNIDLRYSGRGMVGRICPSLQVHNQQEIAKLFFAFGAANESDELTHEIFDYRTDTMGSGLVIYWPHMTLEIPEEKEAGSDHSVMGEPSDDAMDESERQHGKD